MKKWNWIPACTGMTIVVFCLLSSVFCPSANACGHEGWYAGAGYSQLFQFSPDNQLVGGGATPTGKVKFQSRWGGYGKIGYDFCGTRWGVEVPFSFNRQRLNRAETVSVIGVDANALMHIVETEGGLDLYWIAGTGMNIITDGTINNNSGAGGINFNFGPGFQYFFSKEKPRMAMGLSVPMKYTLYFGNHMSRNNTSVFGIPIQAGFTIGF